MQSCVWHISMATRIYGMTEDVRSPRPRYLGSSHSCGTAVCLVEIEGDQVSEKRESYLFRAHYSRE